MDEGSTSIIDQLRTLQAYRILTIRQQVRLNNTMLSMIRVESGWRWNETEEGRTQQNKRAQRILDGLWKGKTIPEEDAELAKKVSPVAMIYYRAYQPIEEYRDLLEKEMRKLAKQLPVFSWIKEIKGVNADTLAVIIGETGDLSNYPTWKHVAKRMGLAPYNGKMGKTWKGIKNGLTPEEWVKLGYNGRRRAIMHMIGVGQLMAKRFNPQYLPVYTEKKAKELERTDENAPKSQGHAHARAMVMMERMFLKDLYRAWKNS